MSSTSKTFKCDNGIDIHISKASLPKADMNITSNDLIEEKVQYKRSLSEIFEGYNGNVTLKEIGTGQLVGEEII